MKKYISPKKIFFVLRFFGKNLGILPPESENRKKFGNREFWFLFCLLNQILLLLPTGYSLYKNFKTITAFVYSWLEFVGFVECILILIFTKYNESRFQVLIELMEKQLERRKPEIIKKYATMYVVGLLIILSLFSVSVITFFIIGTPESSSDIFLTSAVYPFLIDSNSLKMLVYLNQAFVVCITSVIPNFEGLVVFMILMCTDNLKVLEHNLHNSKSYDDIKICIKDHSNTLFMITEVNAVSQFMILKTVFSFVTGVIACGLGFVHSSSRIHNTHQIFVMILIYMRIVLCAETANNMSSASEDIQNTVYASKWYNEDRKLVKAKILIIQKCQELPIIQFRGFMSALNRHFLGTILGTTYSYFMTLKTITNSDAMNSENK